MNIIEIPKLYGLITSRRKEGCFGVLFNQRKEEFAVFLTRTFGLENKVLVDVGEHRCFRSFYHKGIYPTFEIFVPDHTKILFHKLNWAFQSEGCIGIAESFDAINGKAGIGGSEHGFNEFWNSYKAFSEFTFVVEEFIWPYRG